MRRRKGNKKQNIKSIENLWAASLREYEPYTQPRLKERSEPGILPGEGVIRCLPHD